MSVRFAFQRHNAFNSGIFCTSAPCLCFLPHKKSFIERFDSKSNKAFPLLNMFCPHGKKKLLLEIQRAKKAGIVDPLMTLGLAESTSTKSNFGATNKPSTPGVALDDAGKSSVKFNSDGFVAGEYAVDKLTVSVASTTNMKKLIADKGTKGVVIKRIMESTSHFRPERDSIMTKAFQNKAMELHIFRTSLQRAFWLKFTDEEFDAVVEIFDTSKRRLIDGFDFMVAYTKLNSIRKDDEAAVVKEKQEAFEREQAEENERKQLEAEKRMNLDAVDFSFSEKEKASGLKKQTDASVNFDPTHPASPNLDSLMGTSLRPAAFRFMKFVNTRNISLFTSLMLPFADKCLQRHSI